MVITRSTLTQNRVNCPYTFLGVLVLGGLHYVIRHNYHKTIQIITFFPHYGKFLYFFFKLSYFMPSEKCTKYFLSQKNTQTNYQKRVTYVIFGIEVIIETTVS